MLLVWVLPKEDKDLGVGGLFRIDPRNLRQGSG